MKTNIYLSTFIVLLACAMHGVGGEHEDLAITDDPRVLTVLCGANATSNRVVVVDLHDAEAIEVSAGSCTIVNLTAELIVAEKLTIQPVENGRRIKVLIEGGIVALMPCFGDSQVRPSDYVMKHGMSDREFSPSDVIRINGETMALRDAARRFPELPEK